MGALTVGIHELLLATERAWSKLGKTATEIPGFGSAEIERWGLTQYQAAAALGAIAFLAIYSLVLPDVFLPLGRTNGPRRRPTRLLRAAKEAARRRRRLVRRDEVR